jgi:hypothetical protein
MKTFNDSAEAFKYAYKKFLKVKGNKNDGNCSFNFFRNTKGIYVKIYDDFTTGNYNVGDYLRTFDKNL